MGTFSAVLDKVNVRFYVQGSSIKRVRRGMGKIGRELVHSFEIGEIGFGW